MNKKQAKRMKKGYREAGQLYWTDEMTAILKNLHRAKRGLLAALFVESVFLIAFFLRIHGLL